jgi:hypothetical protein
MSRLERLMSKIKPWAGTAALLAVIGVAAAGCASAESGPPQLSNAASLRTARSQPAGATLAPDSCAVDKGVSLHPCKVLLDNTDPEATITAKGPTGGKFSYNDKRCTKNSIAILSGSGHTYMVTAGGNAGTCTALFTDKNHSGGTIGTAKLYITNKGI